MTITDRLIDLDGVLVEYNEGEWGQDKPKAPGFHSFNDAGVESEVGEYFYSMVRLLQPDNVLETGTHWGVSASYIGLALKDNQKGHLDTFEFLSGNHIKASIRIQKLSLGQQVTTHFGDIANFTPEVTYKMVLLDTEPQTRFDELIQFYDVVEPGGFIFIHDLHRHMHQIPNQDHGFAWPFGELPEFIKDKVKKDELRPFHFSTPRGLTGFYKVHPDDHKWTYDGTVSK